jgi:hypothetical protein
MTEGYGIAVDASGNAYVTGETESSDFPAVVGPDTSHNGGSDAFVAKVGAGGGGPFTGTISPVYPSAHTASSTVMQGGTAYRHFRLLDSSGNPIPNAAVAFSVGDPATTDAQGYFTCTVPADALGNPGSYSIRIRSVTIGGQTYTTNDQPTFGVEVQERRYSHAWSYGASTRAKGGVSAGYIAYLQRTTSGGLELKLDESNPDATSDDVVLMKEDFSDESSAKSPNFTNPMPGVEAAGRPEVTIAGPESSEQKKTQENTLAVPPALDAASALLLAHFPPAVAVLWPARSGATAGY